MAPYAATAIDFADWPPTSKLKVRFIAAVQAEIDQLDQRIQRRYT